MPCPWPRVYQVGTAAMVNEGVQRGVWRNEDEIIPGVGLGLAGKTFDYQYDAQQVAHGDRTWHILARNAFTLADFPGVTLPPTATCRTGRPKWSSLPSAM